jgi:hypothetical protein
MESARCRRLPQASGYQKRRRMTYDSTLNRTDISNIETIGT